MLNYCSVFVFEFGLQDVIFNLMWSWKKLSPGFHLWWQQHWIPLVDGRNSWISSAFQGLEYRPCCRSWCYHMTCCWHTHSGLTPSLLMVCPEDGEVVMYIAMYMALLAYNISWPFYLPREFTYSLMTGAYVAWNVEMLEMKELHVAKQETEVAFIVTTPTWRRSPGLSCVRLYVCVLFWWWWGWLPGRWENLK